MWKGIKKIHAQKIKKSQNDFKNGAYQTVTNLSFWERRTTQLIIVLNFCQNISKARLFIYPFTYIEHCELQNSKTIKHYLKIFIYNLMLSEWEISIADIDNQRPKSIEPKTKGCLDLFQELMICFWKKHVC